MKRFAWLIFGLMPTVSLALLTIGAVVATVVFDHDILGRDADGWPVLYKTATLRQAVDVFHVLTMCTLPAILAIAFLKRGMRTDVPWPWIVLGGVLACAFGSIWLIRAAWTGVKGTSDLVIDTDEPWIIAVRLVVSLTAYGVAALPHFRR